MTFKKKKFDNNIIYQINGDLTINNFSDIDELNRDIKKTINKDKYNIIWDLENAPIIDSTGLSIIAITVAYSIKNNTLVKICGVNPENSRLFKISRMGGNVKLFACLDEALEILVDINTSRGIIQEFNY